MTDSYLFGVRPDPFWKRVADLQDNGKPKRARCRECGWVSD